MERLGQRDAEDFADLHAAIEEEDLESVEQIVENHGEEQVFSFEETSALYKAFQCKNYDTISFLIHSGAKFLSSEDKDVYNFGIDLDRLNHLLLHYNKKSDRSCIHKLISVSQSPQILDGERLNALKIMYKHFFESRIVKLLMNVLERESFDIVLDFDSDKINRVHRLYEEEAEIFGLTLSNSKEIFVGAKNLLSRDQRKTAKVYGVVAEELCHLALTTVFRNNAKPYKEEESNLVKEFQEIVLAVKSLIDHSCHVESVIQDVFENYERFSWECELIARVPHVIGIHGEEYGRRIFQESSELSRLLSFYEQNVHTKCIAYTDPSLNTRPHREMEQLVKKNDLISFKEKQIRPLKEEFKSFREYLVVTEGISVITTNCTKLCILHVYHELKKEYGYLVEKKCLFFTRKCFERKIYKIRNAMKGNLWEYLILVMDKRELNLSRFQAEYLEHLEDFTSNGMKLIMISSSQSTDQKFDFQKAVNYKWSDLSEEYKTILQCITYLFKGEEEVTYVRKEYFSKVFNEHDISMIISGEVIEVEDGNDLFSQGYVPDTYIEREFYSTVVDDKIFKKVRFPRNIFLSGLKKGELRELPFDEDLVQWLQVPDDEIENDKCIFIIDKATSRSFESFRERNRNKINSWLHHHKKEFYPRHLECYDFSSSCHLKQKTVSEEEILDFLKRERVILISDNAGYGKSTVISSLIGKLKRIDIQTWNWRLNFDKFSGNIADPLSIAHIEEESSDKEVLEHLFLMLGLKNGLERHLFWEFAKRGHCFIFFDGFDEIPSEYVSNALKLLSTIRKETNVNMVISTRQHHQEELEQLLNTYSHQLAPVSRKDQLRYLGKLWKSKLKYPCGNELENSLKEEKKVPEKIKKILKESKKRKTKSVEEMKDLILALENIDLRDSLDSVRSKIDDLNFCKLAEHVIDKTSFNKEILQFMGIPLHLFMIGIIHLDSNFNVEIQTDIYSVYSKFIQEKILIFVEEKQGMIHNMFYDKILKETREDAYRVHIQLANQLLDNEKLDVDMNKEDLELCTALGIVFFNGVEINFLHQTFAEFFIAESIRLNFNKKCFIDLLFDNKYKVVRRFLSSALEEKMFGNFKKEFFKDIDVLVTVLQQFVEKKSPFTLYRLSSCEFNFDTSSVAKIVKCLLEMFEKTVDQDLLNSFLVKIESEILLLKRCHYIGGCLSVKMLKTLSNVNMGMIFGMVRYYSNPEEVVDVLKECISIAIANECGTNEEENVDRRAKGLLKLLKMEDSGEMSLIYHATWNLRAEILANLLKFTMDVLGEEQFINEVVRSNEYNEAMDRFIKCSDIDRISGLLKEFHSVFDNEIEIFFDMHLKFRIVNGALNITCESSNSFEVATSLIIEYFGIEKLKDLLLNCDSEGDYLIHSLVAKNKNAITNLSMVSNILDDRNKMKQILESKSRRLRNTLHFAAENKYIKFSDYLQILNGHLEKEEIRKMLISGDKDGRNVLHLLLENQSSEVLIESLNLIKVTLADSELFKQLLMSKDRNLNNIFHLATLKGYINFDDVLQLCNNNLKSDQIKEMLFCASDSGKNALHSLIMHSSSETLFKTLNLIKESLADDALYKQILLSTDRELKNIIHLVAMCQNKLNISSLNLHLYECEIKDLLIKRCNVGRTCLHYGGLYNQRNLPALLDFLYEMLEADGSQFEDLILAIDDDGNTFLHMLSKNCCIYDAEEYYFKCHYLIMNYFFNKKDLSTMINKLLTKKLSDDLTKKLLRIRNKKGQTFLQIESLRSKKFNEVFEEILEKNLFDELLQPNKNV